MPDLNAKTLNRRRQLLLWPLAACVKLWSRTLRFDISTEVADLLRDTSAPTLILVWHNGLFVVAEIYRRFRKPKPTYGLVSASNDGAWLAAFFELMHLHAVRGSSSRGGREAVSGLIRQLELGHDVSITPDGPRGPVYSFKPGPAIVAVRAGAHVLLVDLEFTSAWRLKSWDGFFLPRPFSKVKLRATMVSPEEIPKTIEGAATFLKDRLELLGADAECQRRGEPL